MRSGHVDKAFLISFIVLILSGFLIFTSASLGLLARDGATFSSIAYKQAFVGLILGAVALFIAFRFDYRKLKKHAFYILIFSIILTATVFIPGLGFTHGGARRWLDIGPISFQPSEVLKLGLVIYFAAWLAAAKQKIEQFRFGLIPLCVLLAISGVLMVLQPDTGTYLVMVSSLLCMFIAAGGRWRDLGILFAGGALCLGLLFFTRPYIKARVMTFLDPASDPQGAGYQIQQSQIAIGSGGWSGRGFGQSIQKFNYLPEPIGDSIFAVAGEEFGFLGSVLLILLYLFFTMRGLKIANGASEPFGRLLAVGIVILIVSQSFINIASMLGVLPLTGVPLVFASHGGTALLIAMAEIGLLLQISKYSR